MKLREEYKLRVSKYQQKILTIQLVVMLLGGMVFSLAVITRPILRITKSDNILRVKWTVNMMVAASLLQIVVAAYDILSGCWKLMYPLYLGIAGTSLTLLLELTAIGSSLYLYANSLSMVNEDVVSPWYWVECLKLSSCHERMLGYIHWYILPQVVIAIITVMLQIFTVATLGRLVQTIARRHKLLQETGARYRNHYEETKFNEQWKKEERKLSVENKPVSNNNNDDIQTTAADSTDEVVNTPKRVHFAGDNDEGSSSARRRAIANRGKIENFEMVHTTTYEAEIHAVVEVATPNSIIMEDHGYIAGSRVSLDIDKP